MERTVVAKGGETGPGTNKSNPEWSMEAEITMRQVDSESIEELHYVLTVSNPDWNRNLPSGAMLQTYIHLKDTLAAIIDSRLRYENFVQTIKYVRSDNEIIKENRYFYNASCGEELLSTLYDQTFAAIEAAEKSSCGFYLPNLEEMTIKVHPDVGLVYTTAFTRKFTAADL